MRCIPSEKHDAFPGEKRHSHVAVNGFHKGSLLGSARSFCAAFYHVKDTPEAGMKESCLRCNPDGTSPAGGAPRCTGKSVVAVARLSKGQDGSEEEADVYVSR